MYQLSQVDLDPLVSFPQILLTGVHVQLLDLCFGNPLPEVAYRLFFTLFPRPEEQKVASVFRRWKLSTHLFFTVTCSGPHFTKCLVSFIIVSGKESSIKIVLVRI